MIPGLTMDELRSALREEPVPAPLERVLTESAFNGGKTLFALVYAMPLSERDEVCGFLLRIEHPYCRSIKKDVDRIVKFVEDLRELRGTGGE
jgi:hypothetical protein